MSHNLCALPKEQQELVEVEKAARMRYGRSTTVTWPAQKAKRTNIKVSWAAIFSSKWVNTNEVNSIWLKMLHVHMPSIEGIVIAR